MASEQAIAVLAAAIKVVFDADAPIQAAATGGIHYDEAPIEIGEPYIVVEIRSEPFRVFGPKRLERLTVTFTVIDKARGMTTASEIMNHIERLFDAGSPVVTGYHLVSFLTTSDEIYRLDSRWNGVIEYECLLEKT